MIISPCSVHGSSSMRPLKLQWSTPWRPRTPDLILPVHSPEKGPSVAVEGLFGRGVYHECGSVHIDDGGELISLESKAEGYKAIQVFFGDAGQLSGRRVLQHEAYFGQATILLAFARPVQCVPCSVLLE